MNIKSKNYLLMLRLGRLFKGEIGCTTEAAARLAKKIIDIAGSEQEGK